MRKHCPYCGNPKPCTNIFCRRTNTRLRQKAFVARVRQQYGMSYKQARRRGLLVGGQRRGSGVTIGPPIKRLKWQGSQSALKVFWSRPAAEWTPLTFAKAVYGRIDLAALGGAARALQHLRRRAMRRDDGET